MKKKKNKGEHSNIYLIGSVLFFLFFLLVLLISFIIIIIMYVSPAREYMKDSLVINTIIVFLILFLASSLVASIIFYFAFKKLLKPVVELSKQSMKVADGDFSIKINEKSKVIEIQNCIDNFNTMVEKLNKVETFSNDFITNVSHEFKTPLSVIRSNINIIEESNLNEEETKKCFSQINMSIDKMTTLVSNVLKISKLDNNGVKLNKKNYRLDEQIRQCILSFNDEIDKKDISFDIMLEECIIYADENILEQVWLNLIGNAIKFSHKGGQIKIRLKNKDKIKVLIEDYGIGMSEETKERIFDRFYQGETSHNSQGNGLGLTIVNKIIKLCEGEIYVDSEINKFTRFTIFLKKEKNNEKFK